MHNLFLRVETLYVVIVCTLIYGGYAQNVETQETTTAVPTSPSLSSVTGTTTTVNPPVNISCEDHNNDCKACVALSQCYYCDADNKCRLHIQNVMGDGQCAIKNVHYLTCRMSFKVMVILVSVMIGIALLVIVCVCCYCCCKKKGVKLSKDDLKWARQREERKQIAAERRKERAERTEEIRKKYGLVKDSNPYQRFDA